MSQLALGLICGLALAGLVYLAYVAGKSWANHRASRLNNKRCRISCACCQHSEEGCTISGTEEDCVIFKSKSDCRCAARGL